MRIIDEMAKKLKLPETVMIARDIADAGNTSAASIPLATHRLLQENPRAQRRACTADRLRSRTGLRRPSDRASVGRSLVPRSFPFFPRASNPTPSRTLGLNHFRPRLPAHRQPTATTRKGAING